MQTIKFTRLELLVTYPVIIVFIVLLESIVPIGTMLYYLFVFRQKFGGIRSEPASPTDDTLLPSFSLPPASQIRGFLLKGKQTNKQTTNNKQTDKQINKQTDKQLNK